MGKLINDRSGLFKNNDLYIKYANISADELLKELETTLQGVLPEQAAKLLQQFGKNEIAHDKPKAWYLQLLDAFLNPFVGVLIALGAASLFTDIIFAKTDEESPKTIIVISIMIIISVLLRFSQEYKSGVAAENLKSMVRNTCSVLRLGQAKPTEIPLSDIVKGDIIYLSAGDMIPADMRILSSKDLFISQSSLTGEAMPVEKTPAPSLNDSSVERRDLRSAPIKDRLTVLDTRSPAAHFKAEPGSAPSDGSIFSYNNLCFMGTNVVSGSAVAVVMTTGSNSYFGSMARDVLNHNTLTSFDKGINKVSIMLISFMAVMLPIVFFINGFSKGDWLQALLFAVSVAVGLTPEMLPMIVTTNLAKSAIAMAKRKTIVKRLNSIQNFGAIDILCTDKTGTLTQNKIILEKPIDMFGNENFKVLEYGYLNSLNQTGLKNLLDLAILDFGNENGMHYLTTAYRKIDEIPFDFIRRRMSVVVQIEENENLLICKGAVNEVMQHCKFVEDNDQPVLLSDELIEQIKSVLQSVSEDGMRILAIGYKKLKYEERTYGVDDEKDMTLVGFIAFLDPPKETAGPAIAALNDHGIEVKVLTGDEETVTAKICQQVGLKSKNTLRGVEIEKMSDVELQHAAVRTTIFASMSPLQKSRVIVALQAAGHTVGFLGDGINDAPALRAADVGISVDTAVDIAKESADIILLEKSLMVLEEGVIEGRKTFGNIIKYIKMTASSNFGNVFSVLIASAFLPFLPMLPIHLLIQNLLYDFSQMSLPWDNVDPDFLKKPRKWEATSIAKFVFFVGPISSIFDIVTFVVLWNYFGFDDISKQSYFQSAWFIEGLLTQTLIVHMIRTPKVPFFQSRASLPVLMLTFIVGMIGLYIPFSPLASHIGMSALPFEYFPILVAIILGYAVLTQMVKMWYIRMFKGWL